MRSDKQVAGFIPRTGNAGLNYSRGKYRFSAQLNYTGNYLNTFSTTPQRNIYRAERTIVNLGAGYQWKPAVAFFLDVTNIFNEPQKTYIGDESRQQRLIRTGQAVVFGVNGRF